MMCTHSILGFKSYSWNVNKIMKALKWNTVYHMIIMESILFIHKCVFENSPKSITQLLTFSLRRPQNSRNTRKPLVKMAIAKCKR